MSESKNSFNGPWRRFDLRDGSWGGPEVDRRFAEVRGYAVAILGDVEGVGL
jgi:hypothetical protein